MTRQDIGTALELLHGMGMSNTEVAAWCGCTVRQLEIIDTEVMVPLNGHFRTGNVRITLPSKNWDMVENDDIPDYHQSR